MWEWARIFAVSFAFVAVVMFVIVIAGRGAETRRRGRGHFKESKRPGADDRTAA